MERSAATGDSTPFEGPAFHLQNAHPANWTIASADESALIVGRENTIHFKSDAAACVETVTLKNEQGKPIKATWSSPAANELELKVPLKEESPGKITMLVKQYGAGKADEVELRSYFGSGASGQVRHQRRRLSSNA